MRLDHLLSKEPSIFVWLVCSWMFFLGLVMFLVSGWNVGLYHVCGGALLGFEGSVVSCVAAVSL